jgi:ATP-binding cassette subfamily B protein
MFGEKFKRKYALSDKGVHNTKMGMLWTIVVNLLMMGGMGLLYFMMQSFISTLTENGALPNPWLYVGLTVLFVILSLIVHLLQYHATYGLVYGEVKTMRIGLAERLRRLPLGYFGKRDLADLTETIMGDVNRMEHVWSHVMGYLYGSYISTAVIAVVLLIYDWRLAIAALWGVPVAFALLLRLMASSIFCDSSRRTGSISYRAMSSPRSAGVHMQSPSTFLANTVEPAPITVTLIMDDALLYR